jgi:lysophospholipase L1-like esterase
MAAEVYNRAVSLSRKLLFSMISLLLFCAVAEGVARLVFPPPDVSRHLEHEQIIQTLGLPSLNDTMIADPALFWKLKPDLKGRRITGRIRENPIGFTVSTNHDGLRSPEIPPAKRGLRILALGDSTTFGLGVEDDQTWPAILQQRLRAELPGGVEVINAGVPGYTAYQGLRYFEMHAASLRPDLVLATFGFNDADSWGTRSDFQTAWMLRIRRWEKPFLASRLYGGLKQLARREVPAASPAARRPRLSPREFQFALSRLRDECSARRIPLVLVIWPYANQMRSGGDRLVIYQPLVEAFGARQGVPVVNLVKSFTEHPEPLFFDHVHANPAGCRAAAEALARFCLDWMPGRGSR